MKDFAAIDFETANECPSSVCSVGVVVVREGKIVGKLYRLIRPCPDYYAYWNTRVHGLTSQDTAHAQLIIPFIVHAVLRGVFLASSCLTISCRL